VDGVPRPDGVAPNVILEGEIVRFDTGCSWGNLGEMEAQRAPDLYGIGEWDVLKAEVAGGGNFSLRPFFLDQMEYEPAPVRVADDRGGWQSKYPEP